MQVSIAITWIKKEDRDKDKDNDEDMDTE